MCTEGLRPCRQGASTSRLPLSLPQAALMPAPHAHSSPPLPARVIAQGASACPLYLFPPAQTLLPCSSGVPSCLPASLCRLLTSLAGYLCMGASRWDLVLVCVDTSPGGPVGLLDLKRLPALMTLTFIAPAWPAHQTSSPCILLPLTNRCLDLHQHLKRPISAPDASKPALPRASLGQESPSLPAVLWSWPWSLFFPHTKVNAPQNHPSCPQNAAPDRDRSSPALCSHWLGSELLQYLLTHLLHSPHMQDL